MMEIKKDTEGAFKWIITIFNKHDISFQITGGLAAKIYGSKRPLNDIDIDIHDSDFSMLAEATKGFINYGPARYVDERWDCQRMGLYYQRQEIDITGGDTMKVCDARTGEWKDLPTDFLRSMQKTIFGIVVPVIYPQDLIAYKSMLVGEHQKEDIKAAGSFRDV